MDTDELTGTDELPVVPDMVRALQLTGHGGHGDRGPGSGRRRGRLGGRRDGGGAAAVITQPGQVAATGAGAAGPEPSEDAHRSDMHFVKFQRVS
jgi:hypothetical protein